MKIKLLIGEYVDGATVNFRTGKPNTLRSFLWVGLPIIFLIFI